jgi:transposase
MNNALMLAGWDVTEVKITGDVQEATASYRSVMESCPKCGSVGRLYRHGTKAVEYRDAPAFGKQLVIRCKVQRFRCRDCHETCMQPLPDMDAQRQMTKRCVAYIEEQGVPRTFADLARDIGASEATIRSICTESFKRRMAAYRFEAAVVLGIDELELDTKMRGHFMDLGTGRTLDVIRSDDKWMVADWLSRLPHKDRVKIVTIDMKLPFLRVVRGNLPKATVVIDKFHVLRYADDALKKVRAKARSKAAGGDGKNPRRNVTLLRKRAHRLNPAQEFELDGILKNNPVVAAAYRAKESFYDIWKAANRPEAERLFDAWVAVVDGETKLVRTYFGTIARMVQRWREHVFAYFDYRATNALTENRNGIIKQMNRAGRGYSFDVIRAKAVFMKPLCEGPLRECKYCKGQYSAKSFKKLPVHLMAPQGNSKFDKLYRDTVCKMEESCINCHFSLVQRVPGPPPPLDPDSVFIPAMEFWLTPLDKIIEKYGAKFHTESIPDEMFK